MIRVGRGDPVQVQRNRFPGEDTKGWGVYAVMRSLQLRSLRLPKPRERWNGQPVKPKAPKPKI